MTCPHSISNILSVMNKAKISKTVTRIELKRVVNFDDFSETLKDNYLSDIIVAKENKRIVVYCLTNEVKYVVHEIKNALEEIEDCE